MSSVNYYYFVLHNILSVISIYIVMVPLVRETQLVIQNQEIHSINNDSYEITLSLLT